VFYIRVGHPEVSHFILFILIKKNIKITSVKKNNNSAKDSNKKSLVLFLIFFYMINTPSHEKLTLVWLVEYEKWKFYLKSLLIGKLSLCQNYSLIYFFKI